MHEENVYKVISECLKHFSTQLSGMRETRSVARVNPIQLKNVDIAWSTFYFSVAIIIYLYSVLTCQQKLRKQFSAPFLVSQAGYAEN